MKRLRPFLLPAACFAAAWTVARFASGWLIGDSPVEHPPAPRVFKTSRTHDQPRKQSTEKLADDFRTRPMSEWAALWDDFARQAAAGDLQELALLSSTRRDALDSPGNDLLQMLGREELAVRTGRPMLSPESFSSLAETDSQVAWESLARHNRNDFATAALRTLAWRDPGGTLRRFQAMPEGLRSPGDESRRANVWHTPLGSIFGAWARRDPAAATAAVMELPPAHRVQAANHAAMTWAFRDGPSAIRYILDFNKSGKNPYITRHLRLDVMLRASFRTHPAETARLMEEHAMLREVIGEPPCQQVALRLWYDADPEAVLAWLLEPRNHERDSIYWLFNSLVAEPETAARLIRELSDAGSRAGHRWVKSIYRRDPALALSLAGELGISLLGDPEVERIRIADEPADACDRWLEALRRHGDPGEALAALGWTPEMACELAARAARVFPGKAAELAKLVPASSLDATNLWRRGTVEIARFWPELAPFLKPLAGNSGTPESSFPDNQFHIDPATAAEALLLTRPGAEDVRKAVERWAPHDFQAARAWLSRIPDDEARRQGEFALVKIQASHDPASALDHLAAHGEPDSATRELWGSCLRRIAISGGDWQAWLDRMPGEEARREDFAGFLERDVRLLESIRRTAGD